MSLEPASGTIVATADPKGPSIRDPVGFGGMGRAESALLYGGSSSYDTSVAVGAIGMKLTA